MTPSKTNVIRQGEQFLLQYVAMPTEYALTMTLWAMMTYLYIDLDVLPYLVLTSETKRSGKTMTGMDLLRPMCCNPEDISGMTPAVLYRTMGAGSDDEESVVIPKTLFVDEAETLASGAAGPIRTVLNIGYKKGQTVKRIAPGGGTEEFQTFAPKCFILIGDVYDTLRDRSIVLWLRRASMEQMRGLKRLIQGIAEAEANEVGATMREVIDENRAKIVKVYHEVIQDGTLDFLPARDAEIWASLFAICKIVDPSRMKELQSAAIDLAMKKTQESRKHTAEAMELAEQNATKAEFAERLLIDVAAVMKGAKAMKTEDVLAALKDIPTAPWRMFRGVGLKAQDLSDMLDAMQVQPKVIRFGKKGTKGATARGYSKEQVDAAIKRNNLR